MLVKQVQSRCKSGVKGETGETWGRDTGAKLAESRCKADVTCFFNVKKVLRP